MDALRAPIGGPPTRVGDGDYFVIFVLSFAVAQCLSSVFGTSFVSCEGFCIYYTIVHNCRTETPDLCLGGNSPLDCFYSPSCVSLAQEISLPAGSGKGLCPLNPARAARPLTLARALPSRQHKSGVSVRRLQVYVRNGVQPSFIEKEKEITEETQCVTAYY